MSRILVVGGAGFLGSHVADRLTVAGHNVTILDQVKSPYLNDHQTMIVGNLDDPEKIREAVDKQDIVYNFACIADIKEATQNPTDVSRTNVVGHVNLLESCIAAKVERFVYASTLYVYGQSGSFYRISKQSAELFLKGFHEEFSLPYTILRLGTLYGPRAPKWNGFDQLLRGALVTKKLEYQGSGEEVREFLHVFDAADCCVEVLEDDFLNSSVIINGLNSIKGKDFVDLVLEIFDGQLEVKYKYKEGKRPGHYVRTPFVFKPEETKQLNMKSYISLGEGIVGYLRKINADLEK